MWTTEVLSTGSSCPSNPQHKPKTKTRVKRMTYAPQILVLGFGREGSEGTRLEHVELTEFLDIRPYADGMASPSEQAPGATPANFNNRCIYRLLAVDMYIPSIKHYVAYVRRGRHWVIFDDMHGRAGVQFRHPQVGTNNGKVPYHAVYQQEKDLERLPTGVDGQPTEGFIFTRNGQDPGPAIRNYNTTPSTLYACPEVDATGSTLTSATQDEAVAHAGIHHDEDIGMAGVDDVFACPNGSDTFDHPAELKEHRHQQFTSRRTHSLPQSISMMLPHSRLQALPPSKPRGCNSSGDKPSKLPWSSREQTWNSSEKF